MNWKQYFSKTILERGKAYYRSGRVRRLQKQGDKFCASVQGSYSYDVTIWKKANKHLAMSCDCIYASDGSHCKHMAAVCIKIEEEYATCKK